MLDFFRLLFEGLLALLSLVLGLILRLFVSAFFVWIAWKLFELAGAVTSVFILLTFWSHYNPRS